MEDIKRSAIILFITGRCKLSVQA